jgi:hypothetical protein
MNNDYDPDCADCLSEHFAGKRSVPYRNAMLIIDGEQLNILENF